MKIDSARIEMQASHEASVQLSRQERLQVWSGPSPGSAPQQAAAITAPQRQPQELRARSLREREAKLEDERLDSPEAIKVAMLEAFIEALTGKRFRWHPPKFELNPGEVETGIQEAFAPLQQAIQQAGAQPAQADWGLIYERHETRHEQETMRFSARGVIRGSDSEEIAFDLEVNMSRELVEKLDLRLEAGNAVRLKDPLVINFGRPALALTNQRFSFDLDSDGKPEQVAMLAPGSGLLVHDADGDGKVADGNELFGPASGNGFTELAAHDADQNQWIDTRDPVYNQLRIWAPEGDKMRLLGLGQLGVGAIYLGHLQTPFALKSGSQLQGQLRQTGLYVGEQGVGSVQMVDLAV